LIPPDVFFDVGDPAVSWDGRQVVFSARSFPASLWSLWRVSAEGTELAALTHEPLSDDLDPCWLPDGRGGFASTRFRMKTRLHLVTNLWTINADGSGLARLTSERNGAEEPTIDPSTGRIVYARWWFNRWLPSNSDPRGITLDSTRAEPAEHV